MDNLKLGDSSKKLNTFESDDFATILLETDENYLDEFNAERYNVNSSEKENLITLKSRIEANGYSNIKSIPVGSIDIGTIVSSILKMKLRK